MRGDRLRLYSKLSIAPAIAALCLSALYPFLFSLRLSFTDATTYNFTDVKWVGLRNYLYVARDPGLLYSLFFTLFFACVVVIIELVLGYAIALLFDRGFPGRQIMVTLMLVPIVVAPMVYGLSFRLMLNSFIGIIPYYLDRMGITVDFFGSTWSSIATLVVIDVVQWTSYVFIILYSALQNFPPELREAALVDGASWLEAVRYVVTPVLKPTLWIAGILRFVDALKVFDTVFMTTGGGPGNATSSLSIELYNRTFNQFRLGEMAAFSVVVLLVVSLLLKPTSDRLEASYRD